MGFIEIHFSNGEIEEYRSNMSLSDFLAMMNDSRKFIAIEDKFGYVQIIHKNKVEFIKAKEFI